VEINIFNSIQKVKSFTNGYGTYAVIITASTKSNDQIEYEINFSRKKSRIVIVAVTGMNIPREGFYEKELEITISCSYGHGRYDFEYEHKGIDYPIGYVRWTEKRNMEAMACNKPVIVSDIPCNREWIINNDNGFLANVGDERMFSDYIIRLSKDILLQKSMGEKNGRIALERADWKINFQKLQNIYNILTK